MITLSLTPEPWMGCTASSAQPPIGALPKSRAGGSSTSLQSTQPKSNGSTTQLSTLTIDTHPELVEKSNPPSLPPLINLTSIPSLVLPTIPPPRPQIRAVVVPDLARPVEETPQMDSITVISLQIPEKETLQPKSWDQDEHQHEKAITSMQRVWSRVPQLNLTIPQAEPLKAYFQEHQVELKLLKVAQVAQKLHDFFATECPISVYLRPPSLAKLLVDTHLRNRFEVAGLDGSYRLTKETNMFEQVYQNSSAVDRVKYGCFFFQTEKKPGLCSAVTTYGSCYVLLKDELRSRITFTYGNSNYKSRPVPIQYPVPYLLTTLPAEALSSLLDRAFGRTTELVAWSGMAQYFEVQIHGMVKLDTHLQVLRVPSTLGSAYQATLEQWEKKFGMPVEKY